MSNLDKAIWKHVKEKSTDKLLRSDSYIIAVLCGKADTVVIHADEPLVGNSNSMGVAAKVFENLLGSTKGWLRVDVPVCAVELILEAVELILVAEVRSSSTEVEFTLLVGLV